MAKKGGNIPNQHEKNNRKAKEDNTSTAGGQISENQSRDQNTNRKGDTSRTSSQGRKESSGGRAEE